MFRRRSIMSVRNALYLLLLFLPMMLLGQKSSTKIIKEKKSQENLQELFEDAEFFFESEDYKEALYNFKKLNEAKPDNANINFRIGMCYINIPGQEPQAIPYFENAVKKMSTKYDKSTFEETRAPLFALYYLGNAYRIDNQIAKALEVYKKFREHPYFEEHYNANMVDNEISACERAKLIQDNPVKITKTNLGNIINNANANQKAVVDKNETTLIYLSGMKFYDAVMMSRKVNNQWSEPENISPQIGSDGDCEPACLSADGKELYLVKKSKGNYDIYVSNFSDGAWSTMKPLNKNINSSKMETSASISADGKTLYFSSDKRGGKGKLDIYKSTRQADGDWGQAINLGDKINTENNETTPFITEDGKTLYFSSEGHLNMGGADIFTSNKQSDGSWDVPINAGFPINSTGNNSFYYPVRNGEIAYYTLILPEGYGSEDIYRIENLTVVSRSKLSMSEKKKLRIIVRDKLTNDTLGILFYDQNADSIQIQQSAARIDIHIED